MVDPAGPIANVLNLISSTRKRRSGPHLEEIPRAVGGFARSDDARAARDVAEELDVGVGKEQMGTIKGSGVVREPHRYRIRRESC